MSTKDLIERLNRTTTTRRSSKTQDGESTGGVSTRVGARVIRRRRKADVAEEPPELPVAAKATEPAAEPEN